MNRPISPARPWVPTIIVLLLGVPSSLSCGEEEGPTTASSTDSGPTVAPIMPDQNEGSPSTERSAGSTGDANHIIATLGDLRIDGARFHREARRIPPDDGERLGLEEMRTVLEGMLDELAIVQSARDAGLLAHPRVEGKIIDVLLQEEVLSEVDALRYTDDELRAWFDENQEQLTTPEQVNIAMITIRGAPRRSDEEARARIDAIFDRLEADPALFAELARTHSEDLWASRRGSVGWVSQGGRTGLDAAVVSQAFELELDTPSEPIRTDRGWAILKVIAHREPRAADWSQSRGDVMRAMREERVAEAREELLIGLREAASIELVVEDLDSLDFFVSEVPDLVVATVNSTEIRFEAMVLAASHHFPPGTTSLDTEDRQTVLQKLIDDELLLEEGIRRGMDRSSSVNDQLIEALLRQTYENEGLADIAEEDLLEYFHQNSEDFETSPQVQLRRILLRIDENRSQDEAIALLESIRSVSLVDSDQFGVMARTHSDGTYASRGGNMGRVTRRPRPGFDSEDLDLIFSLQAGHISEPLIRDGEAILYQVVQRSEGRALRFEEARGNIEHQMRTQRQRDLEARLIEESRATYPIEIDEELLASQEVEHATPPTMVMPGGNQPPERGQRSSP